MFPRRVTWVAVLVATAAPSCAQTTLPVRATSTVALCQLDDARITEASGLVASRLNPGCYYVHNDSGDQPRVYLVDRDGRTRVTVALKGATAADYEDIALAPGAKPGTFDVCVADMGDNSAARPHVTIYRFPEVVASETGSATTAVEPTAYRVRYADGPADAEAFCVHPQTGEGYILTKRLDGRAAVYKLAAPWNAAEETTVSRLAMLDLPPATPLARIVTGADIAPDGRRLAVRCYVGGWEWHLPDDVKEADFDRVFQTAPARLILPTEPQGEALCYAPDGRALLTISEGANPTLYEVTIAPP